MFEKLPKSVSRVGIAMGLSAVAFIGATETAQAATPNTYSTAELLNAIDATPTKLHEIITSSNTFRCPASKKDTGMVQPICEGVVINKNGSKIVLSYTYEKGEDGPTDFSIYSITKTNALTGDFELSADFIDDNGTTIALFDDGKGKLLHYLNLNSATMSDSDIVKAARYSKILLDSLQ